MDKKHTEPNLPSEYLERDHRRLEDLLAAATHDLSAVDMAVYDEFRAGLLRHIGIEEKIVLPLLRSVAGCGFDMEAQLRLEHGAIAALLVPPPTSELLFALIGLLQRHNHLEEDPDTLYQLLDECARAAGVDILRKVMEFPEVPISRHINNPHAVEPAKRAVARSGHDFQALVEEGRIVRR
jgi:hypothetical protein